MIIENLRDAAKEGETEPELTLFNDFNGIGEDFNKRIDYSNRMPHPSSAEVTAATDLAHEIESSGRAGGKVVDWDSIDKERAKAKKVLDAMELPLYFTEGMAFETLYQRVWKNLHVLPGRGFRKRTGAAFAAWLLAQPDIIAYLDCYAPPPTRALPPPPPDAGDVARPQ